MTLKFYNKVPQQQKSCLEVTAYRRDSTEPIKVATYPTQAEK